MPVCDHCNKTSKANLSITSFHVHIDANWTHWTRQPCDLARPHTWLCCLAATRYTRAQIRFSSEARKEQGQAGFDMSTWPFHYTPRALPTSPFHSLSAGLSSAEKASYTNQTSPRSQTSIGGLVVKLAVAIRSLQTSDDSASPGFDSRPMHPFAFPPWLLVSTTVYV
jgi:hypothetical protein